MSMLVVSLLWINFSHDPAKRNLLITSLALVFFAFSFVYSLIEASKSSDSMQSDIYFLANDLHYLQPIPRTYLDTLESVSGATPASSSTWFSGSYAASSQEGVAAFLIDPENYFDIFPEILASNSQLEQFKTDVNSILVGVQTMRRFGWEVGDEITLQSSSFVNIEHGSNWPFRVAGSFSTDSANGDENSIYIHYRHVNELTLGWKDIVGLIIFRLASQSIEEGILKEIELAFENRLPSVSILSEHSFATAFISQLEEFGAISRWLFSAAFFVSFIVFNSTQFLSAQERVNDLKLLHYLGATRLQLTLATFFENFGIVLIALLLGIVLAKLALLLFTEYYSLPAIGLQLFTVLLCSIIAILFSFLSTAVTSIFNIGLLR